MAGAEGRDGCAEKKKDEKSFEVLNNGNGEANNRNNDDDEIQTTRVTRVNAVR